jgi:hypothetical protein
VIFTKRLTIITFIYESKISISKSFVNIGPSCLSNDSLEHLLNFPDGKLDAEVGEESGKVVLAEVKDQESSL